MQDDLMDFIADMHARLVADVSVTINITGETGSGKSTLAIDMIQLYNFMLRGRGYYTRWQDCVFYDVASFMKAVASIGEYNIVVLNEGDEVFNRDWQSKKNKAVSQSQRTDRKFRTAKIFICPDARALELNVNRSTTHRLHCELSNPRNIQASRRIVSGWVAHPPPPFSRGSTPYFLKCLDRFAFPKLPESIEREYTKFDRDAKLKLNAKYQAMARGKYPAPP